MVPFLGNNHSDEEHDELVAATLIWFTYSIPKNRKCMKFCFMQLLRHHRIAHLASRYI